MILMPKHHCTAGPGDAPVRILLYSHDAQGLGHARRNLMIAQAFATRLPVLLGRPVTGMLVTAAPEVADTPLPDGFDRLVLPGIRKGPDGYEPRARGLALDDVLSVRTRLLDAALAGVDPDLVIVDRHVYGIRGELRAPLRALRGRRPDARIVLGLREVLDDPRVARAEWDPLGDIREIADLLDAIWVYGDPSVHDAVATGEVPAELAPLATHTGYLARGRRTAARPDSTRADSVRAGTFRTDTSDTGTSRTDAVRAADDPFVLTTAGGGSDGAALLEIAVRAPVPAGHRHLVVTGPQMPAADRRRIARLAGARTVVLDRLDDVDVHVAAASAVVTMGGYNTVCELLATGTPALVVPREVPRTEQLLRARALAAAGAVDVARTCDLDPANLGGWLARAAGARTDRSRLALDGLAAVTDLAAGLLAARAVPITPEVHHAA